MKNYNIVFIDTLKKVSDEKIIRGNTNSKYVSLLNIINKEIQYAKEHKLSELSSLEQLRNNLVYGCCKIVNNY